MRFSKRAAIGIGAMVEEGRSEGSKQAVMRDLDLDAVKAGLDGVPRARGEAGDHRADIVGIHRLGVEMARRLRHLRRRPHDMRRMLERGVTTMRQLAEDLGAVRVDGLGDLAKARNDRRVPCVDEAPGHLAGRMDRLAFEHDQPDAATGPLLMVGHMIVRRHAVEGAEGGEMRLKDEPIAKLDVENAEGREQERKGWIWQPLSIRPHRLMPCRFHRHDAANHRPSSC